MLDTSTFISDLINMGPDANLNLFKVEMSGLGNSGDLNDSDKLNVLSARTTTFVSPQRDSNSIELPYQNVNVTIPSSGTTMPRTLDMTLRIDSGYTAYSTLRSLQLINNHGKYEKDPNKKIAFMTVTAYDPDDTLLLKPVYKWAFKDLYVLTLSKFSYSYDSSNQITCNVGLIWNTYSEESL